MAVASIGEPWGYVPAVYEVDGKEAIANFSCSAISRVRGASRGLLVYLRGTGPGEGARRRLEEASGGLGDAGGELAAALGEADRALEDAILRGLRDEDLMRAYFGLPHYSVAPEQEYTGARWPGEGEADLRLALEAPLSDFLVRSGATDVLLDITHGPNFLPVALAEAAEWACRVAAAQLGQDVSLETFAAPSVRAGDDGVPRGIVVRVASATFRPGPSMRELAWRVLEEEPPPGTAESLSSAAEASAAALLFSLPLTLTMLAAEAPGWRTPSSGWEASALALLSGVERLVRNSGAEPGRSLSLEAAERIVDGLRSMRLPSHLLAASELRKLRRGISEYISHERGRGTVPLESVLGGREYGEDLEQLERNLVAHAGFEMSSLLVELSALGTPEDVGRAKFIYRDWRSTRGIVVAFARGMRARRDMIGRTL